MRPQLSIQLALLLSSYRHITHPIEIWISQPQLLCPMSGQERWQPKDLSDNEIHHSRPFSEIMLHLLGPWLSCLMPLSDHCKDAGQIVVPPAGNVLQQIALRILLKDKAKRLLLQPRTACWLVSFGSARSSLTVNLVAVARKLLKKALAALLACSSSLAREAACRQRVICSLVNLRLSSTVGCSAGCEFIRLTPLFVGWNFWRPTKKRKPIITIGIIIIKIGS
jgi:hypothetical protein